MPRAKLDVAWRTLATVLSFTLFALGALVLGVLVFPCIHLLAANRQLAQRRCRRCVSASFRLFIWCMRSLGVLSHRIDGLEHIGPGRLVVANHPSLIDVVFVAAQFDDVVCVVKEHIRRNLLTHLVARATGYVSSRDTGVAIDDAVFALQQGSTVVMFPEGTRTVPGRLLQFKRGAALALSRSGADLTPVYLWITPPTLAKGQPWFLVPPEKVHYRMEVGPPLALSTLADQPTSGNAASERATTMVINAKLEAMFRSTISKEGPDAQPVGGNQNADRGDS